MNYNELNKADNKKVTLCRSFIHMQPVLMLTSHKTKHIPWCLALKKKTWMWKEIKKRGCNKRKKLLDEEVK
jgi:hypothetical protein